MPTSPRSDRLFLTIVLDGVGIGAQPDADAYGDAGSNTLAHVCEAERPNLPNLASLGLGCIADLVGVPATDTPEADFGRMREVSAGKDSTTGHWELAGLRLDAPFPTYPDGFPPAVVDAFVDATGCGGVLGNRPESGTVIIDELGPEHEATGHPIVYTSADSVFQIAAHKDVIPLDRLYELCRIARNEVCIGEHAVGRVIARPFVGTSGNYTRISDERKDFSRVPDDAPLQDVLQDAGVRTVSIGKIYDLFARRGFGTAIKTKSNTEGIDTTGNIELDFLERGLVVLATIANVAPMLGFLGTVIGMILAFGSIEQAGQVEPALVAGGIKVALITTATGLAIAVPVHLAHHFFISRVDALVAEMEEGAQAVLDLIWQIEQRREGA